MMMKVDVQVQERTAKYTNQLVSVLRCWHQQVPGSALLYLSDILHDIRVLGKLKFALYGNSLMLHKL